MRYLWSTLWKKQGTLTITCTFLGSRYKTFFWKKWKLTRILIRFFLKELHTSLRFYNQSAKPTNLRSIRFYSCKKFVKSGTRTHAIRPPDRPEIVLQCFNRSAILTQNDVVTFDITHHIFKTEICYSSWWYKHITRVMNTGKF